MNTDELITQLARDVPAVPRNTANRRLAAGLLLGALASAGLVILALGVRPDLDTAMVGFSFWMKWGYTISLSIAAFVATAQLARPDSGGLRWIWALRD